VKAQYQIVTASSSLEDCKIWVAIIITKKKSNFLELIFSTNSVQLFTNHLHIAYADLFRRLQKSWMRSLYFSFSFAQATETPKTEAESLMF